MIRTVGVLLVVVVVGATLAFGAAGQTMITEPTKITRPGHYVVARDFEAEEGSSAIRIEADRVTLDLNSRTVEGAENYPTIAIAPGCRDVVIRDGNIRARFTTGIGGSPRSARIERVHIVGDKGTGISLTSIDGVEILNSNIDAGDGHVVDVEVDLGLVDKAAAPAGRCNHPTPVGVVAVDRTLDQQRARHGPGDEACISPGLCVFHPHGEDLGRPLAVTDHLTA